jgi:hypothetical protein
MPTTKSYRDGFEGIEWDDPSSALSADIWDKHIYDRFMEEKESGSGFTACNAPQKRKK